MIKGVMLTCVCLILSVQICRSQERFFSEEEFIAVIKKYHPVAKQASLEVRIAEANILSNRGAFDPAFRMDNARKELDALEYYDQRVTEIKIPTWYGIDLYAGRENLSGNRLNPESTKGSLTYLGFSVPLLQNLIIDHRRAALNQAKIFRDLSQVQRRIAINDLLLDALNAYWAWWQQYELNELMKSSLQNAEKRFVMVKTAFELGDRPAIDTLEAYTQIQTFLIKQNEAFTGLIKANLQLSTFLWKEDESQYELPTDIAPPEWTENKILALADLLQAAELNPELIQYEYKLSAQEIDKKLSFQLLLPQVDLKYNQIGYDFTQTTKAAWFQNDYRFGLSVYMPLRISEGRGEYQKAKFKIEQTRLEQLNKQVQIQAKVKENYTELQQTTSQLSVQQSLVANTKAIQRGEELRFENGEGSLFLINARELKTIETTQKLIELRAENRKAMVKLKWSVGLLQN